MRALKIELGLFVARLRAAAARDFRSIYVQSFFVSKLGWVPGPQEVPRITASIPKQRVYGPSFWACFTPQVITKAFSFI